MANATSFADKTPFSLRAALAQLVEAARLRRARRKLFNQTLSELVQLNDRELADIGSNRSVVRSLAWEHACLHAS